MQLEKNSRNTFFILFYTNYLHFYQTICMSKKCLLTLILCVTEKKLSHQIYQKMSHFRSKFFMHLLFSGLLCQMNNVETSLLILSFQLQRITTYINNYIHKQSQIIKKLPMAMIIYFNFIYLNNDDCKKKNLKIISGRDNFQQCQIDI